MVECGEGNVWQTKYFFLIFCDISDLGLIEGQAHEIVGVILNLICQK
jgi:hypothetical protein